MRIYLKFILPLLFLVLGSNISEAIARTANCSSEKIQAETSNKFSFAASNSIDTDNLRTLTISDVERTINTNRSSSSQSYNFRFRKSVEIFVGIKDIILHLSMQENLFALDKSKIFHSDKAPDDAQFTSDYYVFALRHILI